MERTRLGLFIRLTLIFLIVWPCLNLPPVLSGPAAAQSQASDGAPDYDGMIQQRKELEKKWAQWQERFETQWLKTEKQDRNKDAEPLTKAEAWKALLAAFSEDNPFSRVDDAIKQKAGARKTHWELEHFAGQTLQGREFTNSIGMRFVLIPAGRFMMGSPMDEPGQGGYETPQHRVTISKPFYMQVTEVTQGQWKKLMGENPSYHKKCGDACPVDNVRWTDVQEFIHRLNLLEKTNKYRLPTEAQWEYACRAGSTTAFANGDITDLECQDPVLNEIGWYCIDGPHPVGRKKPNDWGLYDMHGNVWEWCRDGYRDYTGEPLVDPVADTADQLRIYRGGSWYDAAATCRSAQRGWEHPESYNTHIGFRVISLE